MKIEVIIGLILMVLLMNGCINSPTSFSNRSVTYQVPTNTEGKDSGVVQKTENIPSTVNAEKTTDVAARANLSEGGNAEDHSTQEKQAEVK